MAELVSVVLPVFNGEKVIYQTIESLLDQTYKNIELIVVDDASTDSTPEIISAMRDQRIKLYQLTTNLGIAGALNYGLSKASGQYIARADADDYSHPERITKQINFLLNNPQCDLVGTYQKIVGGYRDGLNKTAKTNSEIKSSLLFGPTMLHSTVVFRRKLLDNYGHNLYDPSAYLCEDYELWVRLSADCKFENISEYLCHYHWDQPKNWEVNNPKLLNSLETIWTSTLGNFLLYKPGRLTLVAHKILCNREDITISKLPIYLIHSVSLVLHGFIKRGYSGQRILMQVLRSNYGIFKAALNFK